MPTRLFEPGAQDVLYIVDLSGYVFRAYHAIAPLNGPHGEPTHAVFGTVNMLERLVRQCRPVLFAIAMDSRTPTFRKQLFPEYKAQRPPPPDDLKQQMVKVGEVIRAFEVPVLQKDGFEADDVIAAAVGQARALKWRVVIVSGDKDMMQLVGDDVLMWDTMRDKVFGPPEVLERFGVPVSQVRDYLALVGDSSDNVRGVPGVGPKTAKELLDQFGSIEAMYARLAEVQRKKLRENLEQNRESAELAQRLVTLETACGVALDPQRIRWRGRDVPTLRRIYGELGFSRQLQLLDAAPAAAASGEALPKSMEEVARTAAAAEKAGAATAQASAASTPKPPESRPARPAPVQLSLLDAPARPSDGSGPEIIGDATALGRVAERIRQAGVLALELVAEGADPMLARLVGIGLAWPGGAAYLPLGHHYVGVPRQLAPDEVQKQLGPVLGDAAVAKICHDAKHDTLLLHRYAAPFAGVAFDAMLAAYLLDPETPHDLGDLATRELQTELLPTATLVGKGHPLDAAPIDATATRATAAAGAKLALRGVLGPRIAEQNLGRVLDEIEMPLSTLLAELEERGVLVDTQVLASLGTTIQAELVTLEARAREAAGRDFNVYSPRQLEAILFDELGLTPLRRTKTSRSTDADTLEALSDKHPLPALILELRQISKLKSGYIDALPELVNPQTGRIHGRWDQAVAATGRISSSDPNLQNIPVRSELGRKIRAAFVAPPGQLLLSADYSQIELRVLAHLSKDEVLIDSFRKNQDVHTRTAMEIFELDEASVTKEHRHRAKAVNFGVIYGQGDSGLAKSIGISRQQAGEFIAAYFRRYQGVRTFMNATLERARAGDSVSTLFGRRRLIPDIGHANRARRLAAERVAMNTPIQGTAADLLKMAMLALREPVTPGSRMILTVHDELVFEVPEAEIDEAAKRVKASMESVYPLDVPLVVDVGRGKTWAEAK